MNRENVSAELTFVKSVTFLDRRASEFSDFSILFILILEQGMQIGVRQTQSGQMQIAPITGNNLGLARAEIKSGVREVVLCKNEEGKLGLRIRHINNVSVFVLYIFIALHKCAGVLKINKMLKKKKK